jgi:probable phosphoglycerate mutase
MTIFYLIRHGETDWNLEGRWQGHTDIPLNAIGRAQARRLASRLRTAGVRFNAIYSSDLQRAWETAQIVGAALHLAPQPLPALREIDVGGWSGLTRAAIAARDPEIVARLESGEDVARGGGERFVDLYTRVVGAVERLAADHPGQTLALFTHGGPIRALLMHAARDRAGLPPRHIRIGNTAISILIGDAAGWDLGVINDMAHLEETPQTSDLTSAPPDDTEQP